MNLQLSLVFLGLLADNSPITPLVWVNPSRCLPICSYDPRATLTRINAVAIPNGTGKFFAENETATDLRKLILSAKSAGHTIGLRELFRKYGDQAFVFNKYKEPGRAARPGHSEHQLGTSADLTLLTAEAIAWLHEHAHLFGFVVSYPEGKQRITGYRAESWHVRHVGVFLATELHNRGITLEEWFRENPTRGVSGNCNDCPLPISRTTCGAISAEGMCKGNILTWCYDGALASVDCAVSGEVCRQNPNDKNFSCVKKRNSETRRTNQ